MSDVADSSDLKSQFALQLLLKHNDALAAAQTISKERGYYLFIADNWPSDEYVLQERQRYLELHGEEFFLPSRFDIAHKIIKLADSAPTTEDKLKALKLYTDVMGMTQKAGVTLNQNNIVNNTVNKVMVVTDYGTDAEWEEKAKVQQRRLIASAAD